MATVQLRELNKPGFIGLFASMCKSDWTSYIVYAALKLIWFGVIYVLPIHYFIQSIANQSFVTAILIGAYLLYEAVAFISRIQDRIITTKIYSKLISIMLLISGQIWSPSILLDKALKVDGDINIPEMIPLVHKIIKREANIFTI